MKLENIIPRGKLLKPAHDKEGNLMGYYLEEDPNEEYSDPEQPYSTGDGDSTNIRRDLNIVIDELDILRKQIAPNLSLLEEIREENNFRDDLATALEKSTGEIIEALALLSQDLCREISYLTTVTSSKR